MAGPSPPIDIIPPSKRSSVSPQPSNLNPALQNSEQKHPPHSAMDIPRSGHDSSRPISTRQDSLGIPMSSPYSGTRPISVGNKTRRESATPGSYMNGMSWGGKSVSSLFQDDILMGGTSPALANSPSFYSSSYLPRLEANFWHGLRCCDIGFNDLHELAAHVEDYHSQVPNNYPHRAALGANKNFFRRKSSTPGSSSVESMRLVNQMRGMQATSGGVMPPLRSQMSQDGVAGRSNLATVQDMDTIGDMEMDYEPDQDETNGAASHSVANQDSSTTSNSSSRPPPINSNLANMLHNNSAERSSNSTPTTAGRAQPGQQDSSFTTPTLSPKMAQNPQIQADSNNANLLATQMMSLSNELGNLDFRNGNDMRDLCINDPAKALYTEQGAIDTQQFPNFSFINGAATNTDDPTAALQAHHMAANGRGQVLGEEDRPFKCPVIGCEKAYKNANGLRYHEKHGHATQKLQENGDGTYSIVDPVTSIPYPGTVGMEKEKPYRCETCGKRYKNLNGLKYHRNHSPPCNPDYNFSSTALPGMGQNPLNGGESIF